MPAAQETRARSIHCAWCGSGFAEIWDFLDHVEASHLEAEPAHPPSATAEAA